MPSVKIYSTPSCPWCKRAKEFLKENKISFKDIDVADNEKASKEMGVPVIDIDGKIIVGFDEAKLRGLLNLK